MAPHLRSVQPVATPTKPAKARPRKPLEQDKPHTVTTAAASGSRLDLLIATRDRVAKAVEDADTPARDLAALTRRLLEMVKEIEVLEASAAKAAEDRKHAGDERFDASAV